MKKILLLSNQAKYTYRLRKELVFELINQGYKVELICPYGKELDAFKTKGVSLNHISFDGRGKNPFKELILFARLMYMIFKIKPDIVLSYTIKLNIYGNLAARCLRIPFIANITGLGEGFSKSKKLEKLLLAMYRISFRNVSHIFFQNESNRNYFEEHRILSGTHSVLPGSGINFDEFPLTPLVERKTTKVLFLSRVIKDKGIDEFLDVAQKIGTTKGIVSFHVAGPMGEEYQETITSHVEQGSITYHGEIDDVASFIQTMDIVVSPSYHEGMSNTLLEAAAIGRPIITSDIAGCKEIVHEGVSGYVVPVRDTVRLMKAVTNILAVDKDELEEMGNSGRNYIERKFDRKIVVEKYLEIIQKYVQLRSDYDEENYEEFGSEA
ncbi:glycosyltransferase family 4 protein [Candidatus Enterococcus murrayae]|uniref:Glycosyltransferase family 4 protein n=1 Tax=Candidatus Enterococcus murrayae TaxID=2815321 RepID=A0ABS3HKQ9_9ENTE|nr:glycosyltransferase family 4 protein [Enterococcus sp. MJM16]MBO0454025.1 glycosyltransferase family 4 protein [Enterococcus sp. MJM16]